MKCKTFESSSSTNLEQSINEWLKLNKSIHIQDVRYNSFCSSQYNTRNFSCIIFYKELIEVRKDKLIQLDEVA